MTPRRPRATGSTATPSSCSPRSGSSEALAVARDAAERFAGMHADRHAGALASGARAPPPRPARGGAARRPPRRSSWRGTGARPSIVARALRVLGTDRARARRFSARPRSSRRARRRVSSSPRRWPPRVPRCAPPAGPRRRGTRCARRSSSPTRSAPTRLPRMRARSSTPPAAARARPRCRAGRAHAVRAARGRTRRGRPDQPRDRRGAVRHAQDRRAAPAQRLSQARARRAGTSSPVCSRANPSRSSLDEQGGEVLPAARAELAVRVAEVELDGLGGHEQRLRDRAVGLAGGGALGDTPL